MVVVARRPTADLRPFLRSCTLIRQRTGFPVRTLLARHRGLHRHRIDSSGFVVGGGNRGVRVPLGWSQLLLRRVGQGVRFTGPLVLLCQYCRLLVEGHKQGVSVSDA